MSATANSRGNECSSAPALQKDAAILQLTSHPTLESQHTYYDICPWSHDNRYLVFSSAPAEANWQPFGHDTIASRDGRINVIDLETMEIQELTGDAVYLRHGGAFCMWHPSRHRIYYRMSEESFGSLDMESGRITELPSRLRQLSPDGNHFAMILDAPHGGTQGAVVGTAREDGSDCRELIHREQLYELTPNRDEFRPDDMLLGNTKWHPGGEHLLVAMWIYPHPESRRSLYIVSRDGEEARWLTYFGHHHSWTPDGAAVLFNDSAPAGPGGEMEPRMHLVDFDGTNRRVIFDAPIGSHPLMHPDGGSIVDFDNDGIYVAQLAEGRLDRVAAFSQSFKGGHLGTHAHPVWNRDGSQILYNSAESGHSEIYRISVGK